MKRPINETIEWFTGIMIEKLKQNNYKGDWKEDSLFILLELVVIEIKELQQEIINYYLLPIEARNKFKIQCECGDVANFAMFIADKVEKER